MHADPFDLVLRRRFERRAFLGAALAAGPFLVLRGPAHAAPSDAGLGFDSLAPSSADELRLAASHSSRVVIAWGDPMFPGLDAFDPRAQSAAEQERRFGFNNDFNAWLPLPRGKSERGLLFVNHEYTGRKEMFTDLAPEGTTREQCAIEMAAHGFSVVELERDEDEHWRVVLDSVRNRRLTASSPMEFSGPAAGSEWLRTNADPSGRRVLGSLNDCSGGKTPWGTALAGEENVHYYFSNAAVVKDERTALGYESMGFRKNTSDYKWERFDERFDLAQEPNEGHRFGWIVEVDPYDPTSTPKKHTALGRFRHEGASTALSKDGRAVVYTGDDAVDQFVYKFVSARSFVPGDAAHNSRLLEEGTLYAARFETDGRGRWLPLVPEGPLAKWSQARILVHARLAAQLLGATPMDRPEDIEVSPVTQRVYIACTKNPKRKAGDGGANPRAENRCGHVIELTEARGDLASREFVWNPFLLCGDPERDADTFWAGADPALVSPLACPDNFVFDGVGNLWIATDGQESALEQNDALYAVPTAGPERGLTRRYLTVPVGAEVCGPEFTTDFRTLFVNVQHPGAGGGLETPTSTWPDRTLGVPRPAVVATRRDDREPIG